MEIGRIVEYIDHQKITCAVVLEVKNQRLRLLTENNREVNLSTSRLSHRSDLLIDLSVGRERTVSRLKEVARRREALIENIDIEELWEILNTEQEWIDLDTMTAFCFPDSPTTDHESAVVRAFFKDRLYFKFNPDRFHPYSGEQVLQIAAKLEEDKRRNRITERGGAWLRRVFAGSEPPPSGGFDPETAEYVDIIRSAFLFEKESPDYLYARAMMTRAGVEDTDGLFPALVRLGVFEPDENVDLLRLGVRTEFHAEVLQQADRLAAEVTEGRKPFAELASGSPPRRDLTGLDLMTIDGQSTLDYDDALSIEDLGDELRLGIHIVDVGHCIAKGDPIDREAAERGSSIYTPDRKIPMIPGALAEGLCSLRAGHTRPALSILVRLTHGFQLRDFEILASTIRIKDQLTYYDVNLMADSKWEIRCLREIAEQFRKGRFTNGAVQISLPEINPWISETGDILISRVNRESPSRMLVSELMIMANWLMAKFLAEHGIPAIFRSQPEPRERLYEGLEGTLFQNYMQRRLLSRFLLSPDPDRHSGLGLNAYVTATSPIRKYFDLVTQRQLRAALGLETAYTAEEIDGIIRAVSQPVTNVGRIQARRNRYWLLKYLERQVGAKEEALVLYRRKQKYQVLLSDYMLECELPASNGVELKPEDLVQVTIQHVDARREKVAIFMG